MLQFTNSRVVDAVLPIMEKHTNNLNVRVGQHSGVSPLTRKRLKSKTTTLVKDHMLFCDHIVSLVVFKILASSNSEFHLKIKESLNIA